VCKACFTGRFVFRANVIPGINGDDGGFVVLVDNHGEAVVEDKFCVGDVRDGNAGGFWSGSGRFCFRSGISLRVNGNEKEKREGKEDEEIREDIPKLVSQDVLPVQSLKCSEAANEMEEMD
jgi:hypothetical protein